MSTTLKKKDERNNDDNKKKGIMFILERRPGTLKENKTITQE